MTAAGNFFLLFHAIILAQFSQSVLYRRKKSISQKQQKNYRENYLGTQKNTLTGIKAFTSQEKA